MSLDWSIYKHTIVQIDMSVKNKRQSMYAVVCPNCQCERYVSYGQAFNLIKSINNKECKPCKLQLGLQTVYLNIQNLRNNQHKASKNRIGKKREKSKSVILYRKLFNSESFSTTEGRLKQRLKKLGKRGKDTNAYIHGLSDENKLQRDRDEYKVWRKAVFTRDNYICVLCNTKKNYIEADHIKEWCNYPDLRFSIDNGRTVCKDCHKKTDNYGSKAIRRKVWG